jgi:hypothetical protein
MIKFLDLQKINEQYSQELKAAANDVIDSGWYLLGERVNNFENQLKNGITCASKGIEPLINHKIGIETMAIIGAAYFSNLNGDNEDW